MLQSQGQEEVRYRCASFWSCARFWLKRLKYKDPALGILFFTLYRETLDMCDVWPLEKIRCCNWDSFVQGRKVTLVLLTQFKMGFVM